MKVAYFSALAVFIVPFVAANPPAVVPSAADVDDPTPPKPPTHELFCNQVGISWWELRDLFDGGEDGKMTGKVTGKCAEEPIGFHCRQGHLQCPKSFKDIDAAKMMDYVQSEKQMKDIKEIFPICKRNCECRGKHSNLLSLLSRPRLHH